MNLSKVKDSRSWQRWESAGAVYNPHRIALSVSFCVRRMASGEVDPASVEKIIAGTRCTSEEEWNRVIAGYRESYWYDNPDRCEEIIRQFLAEGKVFQPRLQGLGAPQLALEGRPGLTVWANSHREVVLS